MRVDDVASNIWQALLLGVVALLVFQGNQKAAAGAGGGGGTKVGRCKSKA